MCFRSYTDQTASSAKNGMNTTGALHSGQVIFGAPPRLTDKDIIKKRIDVTGVQVRNNFYSYSYLMHA